MHVTFDFTKIEEAMPQQARKQIEAELETSCCSLGGIHKYGTLFITKIRAIISAPYYIGPL